MGPGGPVAPMGPGNPVAPNVPGRPGNPVLPTGPGAPGNKTAQKLKMPYPAVSSANAKQKKQSGFFMSQPPFSVYTEWPGPAM